MLADKEARGMGAAETGSEHIFLGLVAVDCFSSVGVTLQKARNAVELVCGTPHKRAATEKMDWGEDAKGVYQAALAESQAMGHSYVRQEHILLGLLSHGSANWKKISKRMRLRSERLREEAILQLGGAQDLEAPKSRVMSAMAGDVKGGSKGVTTQGVDELCRDLCQYAREGKIDPVVGRNKEINHVIQILGRRQKCNPILLGEAGVGKTAIAEGLARVIEQGATPQGSPLPDFLKGKRLMQLDVPLLLAGAKERGELETRVTRILSEVKEAGNIILMIDEIHTLVGSGSVGRGGLGMGGLDIANLFKPALARGELRCIGATTLAEHRAYIEKDKALARRFQPVIVDEPSEVHALSILLGLQASYEQHHRCIYTEEALRAAVVLSERYIADRLLPDKAIDVLDEAGSRSRIDGHLGRKQQQGQCDPEAAAGACEELRQVIEAKDVAATEGHFEEAALLRSRELELKTKLSGPAAEGALLPVVDIAEIEAVVAKWTGIPVEKVTQDEAQKLLKLEVALHANVIGQHNAVSAVTRAMRRAHTGVRDPKRPIASFLFCGPTGVGKTELTKVMADQCFGSRDSIVRLDMSEYMERHTVSKLIGAPPGYAGFGDGGKLTEPVRRRPFSIVLLDEIEKAHPDVFNILLQVLEDGQLTDSQGKTVSFKNTVIVMTSNVGSNAIAKGTGSIGFQLDVDADRKDYKRISNLVKEELKVYFRPEMLNRVDEIVVFEPLNMSDLDKVADILLDETSARLAPRGVSFRLTPALRREVLRHGHDPAYGARPLRRSIALLVEDPLADAILRGRLAEGDAAVLDMEGEGGRVVVRAPGEATSEACEGPISDVVAYPGIVVEATVEV
ncbi:unnamed protein product [Ostreobium quekettii]|uniref:Clp R domain-containing protein n=1 Tax=Ostreobium quekettii TaxID=121088 RepID=A0A8S1IYN6_9CHLO|nr:unnamed protein product [Ostreobium quekettii]